MCMLCCACTVLRRVNRYIQDLLDTRSTPRQRRLNAAIASLIEDFSLVRFLPMDREDPDTVSFCSFFFHSFPTGTRS